MILISQSDLWGLLWRSLLYGLLFGLIYDLFHTIGVAAEAPSKDAQGAKFCLWRVFEIGLLALLDLVFCIAAALVSILLMYRISDGVFRGMVYLGMGIGFLIFRLTVSRLLKRPMMLLSKIIRFLAGRVIFVLFLPLRGVISLINLIYRLTIGRIRDKIEEEKRRREEERRLQVQAMLMEPLGEEICTNVGKKAPYRRDGRISFGVPRRK